MNTENQLIQFFPKTPKIQMIRPNQKEALDKIWGAIMHNNNHIIINAPVGSGKSALADTLLNYYNSLGKSCLYTSPLNQLVDQVEESGFSNVHTLKGRVHYECLSGKPNTSIGWCQDERCPHSKRERDCKHKPYGACDYCVCWSCIYKKAFNKFKNSRKGNTNFTLFLMGIDNNPGVIVIDECDVLESFIRSHYSVTIPKLINNPEFRNHIEPLKSYLEELSDLIDDIDPKSDLTSDAQLKERKELLKRYDKIMNILSDVDNFKEPWVVNIDIINEKTKYEPITIERFLNPLLSGKTVVMMSATAPEFPGYSSVEVDSIFPIKTRQWSYVPLGKMTLNHRDDTIPKAAWWLAHLKGKTLVHCVSYLTAKKLSDALRILGVFPLLQTNTNGGDEHIISRYDAVDAFVAAQDSNKILLSVKLDRGVDFWQPDILNNVIAVLPYPNPTEPLTKAKNRLLGNSWQNEQMARDIAQAMGRIFRNEKMGIYQGIETPKRGYIITSDWYKWYINHKKLFPKWFKEAELKM